MVNGKIKRELSYKIFGSLGFFGALVFLLVLIFLHFVSTDIDWTAHYVSDFANGPYWSLFLIAVFIHGTGNLALALGLFRCLESHPLREWASVFFGAAAVIFFGAAAFGIFIAGIFPIDPFNVSLSPVGFTHEAVTAISFPLELAALFLFSIAFSKSPSWEMQGDFSLMLSILAAIGLSVFFVTVLADWMPGLGERIALASFFLWEFWVSWHLMRRPVVEQRIETS